MAFKSQDNDEVMGEINMTPLVDIMLVLLVIFLVTIPVMQQNVSLNLPKADAVAPSTPAPHITLSMDAQGQYTLNDAPVSAEALPEQLRALAQPDVSLHLRADRNTPYEAIAKDRKSVV